MYKKRLVSVIIPAYNEEYLIKKTVDSVPGYVDKIYAINDASTDETLAVLRKLERSNKKLVVLNPESNGGVGHSIKLGLREAQEDGMDLAAVMAGDAQMDPEYLPVLIDNLIDRKLDYVKANRFLHREALKTMPAYRRIGNIVVTILTKFATGYYSIFDTQNGYVVYSRKAIDQLPYDMLSDRYDYENTVLIGLSIIGARVGDVAIPALYGEEKSTIKLFSTVAKVLSSLTKGFWKRIFYKYMLYNFHPIALFLTSGVLLFGVGTVVGLWILFERIFGNNVPTSGTVMLAVLPILLGFQLLLTALTLDVAQEDRA